LGIVERRPREGAELDRKGKMPTSQARSVEERGQTEARSVGLRLALVYGTVAALWIMFSDRALALLRLPLETERFLSSTKGLLYVAVTASALYFFAARHLRQLYTSQERHMRLFEHSTEGLMLFRVAKDEFGDVVELTVEGVNPTQAVRLQRPRQQIIGMKMSESKQDERLSAYFEMVRESAEEGRAKQQELRLETGDVDEFLNTYAIEEDLYALGSTDFSELRKAQQALRHQEEWIREAYVDVLDAVTGGKLILLTEKELEESLGERLLDPKKIDSPTQLGEARAEVCKAVAAKYSNEACSLALMNPLGEAMNNVLKHAGEGTYAVFLREGVVQVCVQDNGPGIDFRTLPKATLVSGFSTAATLGMGFTIMLQLCDRVLISTKPGRTTIVLEVAQGRTDPLVPIDATPAAATVY
jgi:anti-sigma regulatory factor (Ser/Thr protein kinase)